MQISETFTTKKRVVISPDELLSWVRERVDIPEHSTVTGYPVSLLPDGSPSGDVGPSMVVNRHGIMLEWEQGDEQRTEA